MARLEHFALYAANSSALKDFYVDALGMTVALESGGDPPGYFLVDDQGMALETIGRLATETAVNQRWVCRVAFWVDDVAASGSSSSIAVPPSRPRPPPTTIR